MNMVKIATLKSHLSRYLGQVREGREVVVYDRDTPVARIIPFAAPRPPGADAAPETGDSDRLADLERRGVIDRRGDAAAVGRWLQSMTPVTLPAGMPTLSDVHRRMRDEEPW